MPNATVRANARTLPKTTPKPETAKASILRTLADETRRLAALPDKEFESASPSPSADPPIDLDDISNELSLIRDLVEASYMAAGSLPPDIGRDPLSRLLDLTSGRLQDAIDDLEKIREART